MALKKNKTVDGFEREWPNPVVMDEKTIKKIDQIWTKLEIGQFIESPSLNYKNQMKGLEAISEN